MKFTFGIITGGDQEERINIIIDSIESQNIPADSYEILIVGKCNITRKNATVVKFNESIKPLWITAKKNLITYLAKFENIVYMHDYIALEPGWYQGFLQYGNDFKACMTKILDYDNTRYNDWMVWIFDTANYYPEIVNNSECLLPYDMDHLSKIMYFSGTYWVAKKEIMQEFPLDENRVWGQGEDVEWSYRYKQKYKFYINPNSSVKIIKGKKGPGFKFPTEKTLSIFRNLNP